MGGDSDFLIYNVLLPVEGDGRSGYGKFDVLLSGGLIASVEPTSGKVPEVSGVCELVDGTNKMLLPGFVNAHAHSIEQWGRGTVKMMPLELWVDMMYKHCDPRRDPSCPPSRVYLSALHTGVETLMSGGTAIMDHLFCRDINDVEAAVMAYKQLGIRAFIAPMLGDLDRLNMYPLVGNAAEMNEKAKAADTTCNGLGPNGDFRESLPPRDPAETKRLMDLWTESVERFHNPSSGINIAVGPMQNWSASDELIQQSVALRQKYNLCGHIHLLESRAQKLMSRTKYPDGGAVKKLKELGWLDLPGTSCAHSVWLDEEDQKIMAECGAVAVHNPLSNTRLGSGIAPIKEYASRGVTVAIGCDGSCSNDGQDMLEAVKLACILSPLTSPDYRNWASTREVLKMASEGGAAAIGLKGRVGAVKSGYMADLVLYDLTALSLLPRTDPVGLLVLGRPSAGAGGNALHSVWVDGRRVLHDGVPANVDLRTLRNQLMEAQPEYLDPESTDPTGTAGEAEYRAAMGLEGPEYLAKTGQAVYSNFPQYRVNYDADMLPSSH